MKAVPPSSSGQVAPQVLFTEKPAELIAFMGKPVYSKIPGTGLSYATNTENKVFLHQPDGQIYVLISGRWFRAASLAGPWTYAGYSLPAEFAMILRSSPAHDVLVSVPGTQEASDAVLLSLNSALSETMSEYAEWYQERFSAIQPDWYVFPFGKPRPNDPTRPVTTLKTAWNNVRKNAKVKGRWHDHRHTMITDLAESGAGDQTIMDIAGHVSKNMLKHYSHIRMEAKREALESIVKRPPTKKPLPTGSRNSKVA